jgi:hypothetical protein
VTSVARPLLRRDRCRYARTARAGSAAPQARGLPASQRVVESASKVARGDLLRVIVGYAVVALAFTWPLPLHLGSALTGDPGGDTGVYVWNQWVFQHEAVVQRRNPMTTEQILALSQRVDLSQHNYTAFLNVMALPLIPLLGVVPTFNLVFLLMTVLTALTTYALARHATPATRLEAWLAGLAFAWSPVLVARSTGHFSLVAAAPLAAFLLFLMRANRTRRPRDAALTGLCMAWAAFCDVYYAVYCLMIAVAYLGSQILRVTFASTRAPRPWRWTLDILIVLMTGLILGLAFGRGGRLEIMGLVFSVRGLYTPVMVLTMLVAARLTLWLRPRIAVPRPTWSPAAVSALTVGVLACATPLAPVIYGLGERVLDGRYVSPPVYWRSSPRGVDLLGLFEFNPNHALARAWLDRQTLAPTVFVEYTAALSLVALAVVAVALWRGRFHPLSGWIWLTAGSAALALGPFVHVGGVNTHVPGPWALLRYLPLIGAARAPTRFAVLAALGLAILFAAALAALGERYPNRRTLMGALVGALLMFELAPAPRTLYSAAVPAFYHLVAADQRPVRLLELPYGVRDGVSSVGDFSARYQFYQTVHGKQLLGGYLSRISSRRVRELREQPTLDALIRMSEGDVLAPEEAAYIRSIAPRFIEQSRLGYVVIDRQRSPQPLVDLVTDAWRLEELASDGHKVLYRPTRHASAE